MHTSATFSACKFSWSSPSEVKTLENWEKPFTPCQHNIIPKNILNWRQVLLRKIVRESTLLDTVYLFELSSLNCHKSRAVRIIFTIKKKIIINTCICRLYVSCFLLFEKNIILKSDDPNFPDQEAEINMTSWYSVFTGCLVNFDFRFPLNRYK